MSENFCEKKNNLELYLNDVYEKECLFKIEQEEVEFIQTGIETLVQDIVDKILANDSINKLIADRINKIAKAKWLKSSLVEVYFPIQKDSSLQRYATEDQKHVKTIKSTIIKVGSFYEGTKNTFPDEFDFIFLLLGVSYPWQFHGFHDFSDIIFETLNSTFENFDHENIYESNEHLYYTGPGEIHQRKRKIEFEKILVYATTRGKAYNYKGRFIYSNRFGEQRYLHVDLTPGDRVFDTHTQKWFIKVVKTFVEPKTFREEILAAESCLFVKDDLAFTEIEKHFMRNVLSKKHVKVYRLLKFLLNGNGDNEELEEDFEDETKLKYQHVIDIHLPDAYYTSYRIKTLMIYHHEDCTNTDTEDLGSCVLQVLEELSKYENAAQFPKFTGTTTTINSFSILPYLKSTITTLRSMKTSEDIYDYDKHKLKSVSRQCLDHRITEGHTIAIYSRSNAT